MDVGWSVVAESSFRLSGGGWNRSGIRCIERYRHQRSGPQGMGETLPKGSAALALLVREGTLYRVVESLRGHAPNDSIVKSSLSHVDED